MENAVDALKMAFAIFVFLVALSITFYMFTKTKETSDTILWNSDSKNYLEWELGGERIVGVDTVISTLKNRGDQVSYVIIKNEPNIGGTGINEITYRLTPAEEIKVEKYIKEHLGNSAKANYTYKETTREITTDGEYVSGDDGVKIAVTPGGVTRRYIIFEKQP